jgi:hypothetical protein
MKSIHSLAVLMVLLTASTALFSQEKPQTEYLLDMKKVKISGFGNTFSELSMVDGNAAYSSGGGGAFLFNYKYFFGIYSHDLVSGHRREDIYPATHNPSINPMAPSFVHNRIRFNHGGLWFGYIHNPHKLFHWGGSIKTGLGSIGLFDRDIDFRDFDDHHRDWVGVVTPEIDVEVNVARWFKINAGIGYRMVYAVNNSTYTNSLGESVRLFKSSEFSSPTATIKFMFGSFGPKKNGNVSQQNNM